MTLSHVEWSELQTFSSIIILPIRTECPYLPSTVEKFKKGRTACQRA